MAHLFEANIALVQGGCGKLLRVENSMFVQSGYSRFVRRFWGGYRWNILCSFGSHIDTGYLFAGLLNTLEDALETWMVDCDGDAALVEWVLGID